MNKLQSPYTLVRLRVAEKFPKYTSLIFRRFKLFGNSRTTHAHISKGVRKKSSDSPFGSWICVILHPTDLIKSSVLAKELPNIYIGRCPCLMFLFLLQRGPDLLQLSGWCWRLKVKALVLREPCCYAPLLAVLSMACTSS